MAWLSGWSNRKSHNLTGATGAGTSYQIPIHLFYGDLAPYAFSAIGRSQPFTTIHYPSAWYYNGVTYITFGATASGTDYDLYVTSYNHTATTFATPVKVADALLADEHNCPAIMVDNNGYIHIFAACDDPNKAFKHYKSDSAENISAWSAQTDIESADAGHCWGYPKLIRYGNTVWCIYSDHPSSVVLRDALVRKSTDNGATWGSSQTIIVHGTNGGYNYAFYPGNCEISSDGTKIHMTWCSLNDEPGTPIRANDVYHAYLNTSDNHMYSMNGTDLGTSISLPTEAETYCKVIDSGTDSCHIATIHLDSSNYPWIIYRKGASTTTSPDATHTVYHTRWNGSAWVSPETITTTDNLLNWDDFIINSISDVDAYVTTAGAAGRGGDIEEWHWNGSAWSQVTIIATEAKEGYALNSPMVPINHQSDLLLVFCQIKGGDQATPLKVYALVPLDSGCNVRLEGHALSDFGDVRFTDDDGETELQPWLESKIDGSDAWFYAKVADSLTSNQLIYLYCGKAGETTTSSLKDTMIKGDDGISGNFTEAVLGSAAFSHTAGKYRITEDSTDDAFMAGTVLSDWNMYSEIQEFQPSSAGGDGTQIYFGLFDSATVAGCIGTIAAKAGLRRFFILRYTAQTTTDANKVLVMYQNAAGTFYYWTGTTWTTSSTKHTVAGNLTFRIWSDGTNLLANVLLAGKSIFTSPASIAIATVKAFSSGKCLGWIEIYSDAYYVTQDIDNYFIRKYVSAEPTHGPWGEWETESLGQPTMRRWGGSILPIGARRIGKGW